MVLLPASDFDRAIDVRSSNAIESGKDCMATFDHIDHIDDIDMIEDCHAIQVKAQVKAQVEDAQVKALGAQLWTHKGWMKPLDPCCVGICPCPFGRP